MIKLLEELLGKTLGRPPLKKPAPVLKSKRPNGPADFRAVEIAPGLQCCAAATEVTGRSYLLRQAPRLPLPACTMATDCACKFRKSADRRDSDRRLFGGTESNRWFVGREGRKGGSRRSAEK